MGAGAARRAWLVAEDSGHVMRSEASLRWGGERFLARGSSSRADARSTRPFPRTPGAGRADSAAPLRCRHPGFDRADAIGKRDGGPRHFR